MKPKSGCFYQSLPPLYTVTQDFKQEGNPPRVPLIRSHIKVYNDPCGHITVLLSRDASNTSIDENMRRYHTKSALARIHDLAYNHLLEDARRGWKQLANVFEESRFSCVDRQGVSV